MKTKQIPFHSVGKMLLVTNFLVAILYFSWWLDPSSANNKWLYYLLFAGEVYHLFMAFSFWFTVWPGETVAKVKEHLYYYFPTVDIFITVAGEPVEIVSRTVKAAKNIAYPFKNIYVLNDGLVAKKDNWRQIVQMAGKLGVNCITREVPGGAKAGNINNALRQTNGEMVLIFDADMVPNKNFLSKTIPYFKDANVGFVQTPQYYENYQVNEITAGAWDQQKFFFGPILRGKEKSNAAFVCGTNVVLRRKALEEVGGMEENNIAEDFLTSLYIHQKGWVSHYHPEVLAKGLAPMDLMSYYKQQFRWARGSLQVLLGDNPFLKKGLSFAQKIQYLSSALYYFNGLVVLIDISMPLMYLFFGIQPVSVSTASFAVYFLPFMLLNLYTLNLASAADISFNTFSFSYSSWYLQLVALFSILTGKKVGFSVTPKQAQNGNYIGLALPHIGYILLAGISVAWAIHREGFNPSVATNLAWVLFNSILFLPYILVATNFKLTFRKVEVNVAETETVLVEVKEV